MPHRREGGHGQGSPSIGLPIPDGALAAHLAGIAVQGRHAYQHRDAARSRLPSSSSSDCSTATLAAPTPVGRDGAERARPPPFCCIPQLFLQELDHALDARACCVSDADCTALNGSCVSRLCARGRDVEACRRTEASAALSPATCWTASSRLMRPTRSRWPTSRTSGRPRAVYMPLRYSTCTHVASSAGRCADDGSVALGQVTSSDFYCATDARYSSLPP